LIEAKKATGRPKKDLLTVAQLVIGGELGRE